MLPANCSFLRSIADAVIVAGAAIGIIPVFVQAGTDASATTKDGDTPLEVVRAREEWKAVKYLESLP